MTGEAKGTCTFTGGVSDGKYGVMTFKMDDYGVKAQKSWFMFDNEVVCLGSGIGSNVPTDIVTTVNQCHLDGNVWINTGKALRQATQGEFAFEQAPQWIWHDSIAYLFPQGNNIKLKMDRQKKATGQKSISIILLRKSACRYSIWSLITDNLPETHLTHISLYRESTIRKK